MIQIRVECYSGYRGEQTPRYFCIGSSRLEVTEVVDQWLSPNHRYFKVRAGDGGLYILRHDTEEALWEIQFFEGKGKVKV